MEAKTRSGARPMAESTREGSRAPLLHAGQLVQVLPEWRQEANIWAVYPTRLERSAKVRVCVEFLQEVFRQKGLFQS